MKKLLLGTVALAALGAPAIAADMGVRPVYRPVVAYTNWTGCHIGGLVGIEYGSNNGYTTTAASTVVSAGPGTTPASAAALALNGAAVAPGQQISSSFNTSGFNGGGYIGCDYQAGNWVFGVEGDWSIENNSGQGGPGATVFTTSLGPLVGNPFNNHEEQERWYATVRGRLGYAIDKWLFFVSGGGAWARIDSSSFVVTDVGCGVPCHFSVQTDTRSGWTVGGGFDYAITGASLMPGWSVRAEYLYIQFPSYTLSRGIDQGVITGPPFLTTVGITNRSTQLHDNVVRVGFAYKFGNYAAPAVYK